MGARVSLEAGAGKDASILSRESDWSTWRVTVAGIGTAGFSAADSLMQLGAQVTIVDSSDGERQRERGGILAELGARLLLGHDDTIPEPTDLLVVSPGLPPAHPLIVRALEAGIPVWGELELAWRVRKADAAPWLCITGTNGKTTATLMLESMLTAAGLRAVAAGKIGRAHV